MHFQILKNALSDPKTPNNPVAPRWQKSHSNFFHSNFLAKSAKMADFAMAPHNDATRTHCNFLDQVVKVLEISYEKLEAFLKNKIVFQIVAWESQILRIRI